MPLVRKETNGPFVAYYNQAKLPCTFHSVHGGSPTSTCSSHSAGTQFFWNMLRPALPQVEVKRVAVSGSQTQDPSGFTFLILCRSLDFLFPA